MEPEVTYGNGTLTARAVYAAPRERVFDAWVETSQVQQWWGCNETTKVESVIEPRVGGRYCHMMYLGERGQTYQDSVFTEFERPRVIAFRANPPGQNPPMEVRVTFEEVEGGTLVQLVHSGLPDEIAVFVRPGWTAALWKLTGFLSGNLAGSSA
ncbi:SRPBCC domain-containing protein [bacterium]|nr:SRPBCC domain-containing protein [bacterium]